MKPTRTVTDSDVSATTRFVRPLRAVLAAALLLSATALAPHVEGRSTPLGNASFGTSSGQGNANGVQSPSGPGVHPGYRMVSFRNAIDQNWRFGGIDFLSDGRMVSVVWGADCSYTNSSCGSSSNSRQYYGDVGAPPDGGGPGSMHVISGLSGDGISSSQVQQVYTGLWEPLGLYVGRSGAAATDTIYVMTKTGLLRFIGLGPYTNGINPAKVVNTCHARRCINDSVAPGLYRRFTTHPPATYTNAEQTQGTGRRWHHFNYGLVRGVDGFFYSGTGTEYNNGNDRYEQGRDRCAVLKLNPNAGTVEVTAGGLRSPNGWGMGPEGELFFTDIQGNYKPANAIYNYRPGRFYGMRCDTLNPFDGRRGIREAFPAVALNQAGGQTNTDIGANPGELAYVTQGVYAGQMLYGDVTFGGIQRVFLEKIGGEWQGAAFLFSGGFRAGIGRLRLGADGTIYAASQAGGPNPASGNWCWGGGGGVGALSADRPGGNCNMQYDFAKLVPKDTLVFDLLAVRARVNGFELEFTKKVGPSAGNPSNYTLSTWTNQVGNPAYGAGAQQGFGTLTVSSARIHPDSTRVFLQLASMPAASVQPAIPTGSGALPSSGYGATRVVLIRGTGVLAADGSAPWGEPLSPGAAPSRLAAWYTLNKHSADTAFTPVAIMDHRPEAPGLRAAEFRARRFGEVLRIESNFAHPARMVVRDLRGRGVITRLVPPGPARVELPLAGLSRGGYVVEARVDGQTFARPVALY